MIFSVSIKSSQGEFIKSFNLSQFLPTKASHSHFESKPLQLLAREDELNNLRLAELAEQEKRFKKLTSERSEEHTSELQSH